jgi:hypothetical protein
VPAGDAQAVRPFELPDATVKRSSPLAAGGVVLQRCGGQAAEGFAAEDGLDLGGQRRAISGRHTTGKVVLIT